MNQSSPPISSQRPLRIAIVVSHPIQHFVHLYRGLAAQPGVTLKVFFCSRIGLESYFDPHMKVEIKWATDLLGGYEQEFLPGAENIKATTLRTVDNPGVGAALAAFKPDVVQLHGYAQLTLLKALWWCRSHRVPALIWSDSSLLFERPGWKQRLKAVVMPLLLRQFAAVLTTGDNNVDYYRHFGVPASRLFRCPFTVDQTLLRAARDSRIETRARLRAQYGIADDRFVALFVGKLVPWKRPGDLLEAVIQLRSQRPMCERLLAFFAGDGELRSALESQAQGEPAIFAGFINVDLLPSVYAMADVLVFPSSKEPYGLSAREAICVGLPVIVSDQIGCIGPTDAARPGFNAVVYPAGDVDALAAAIGSLLENPARYAAMAAASLVAADDIAEETSVKGFLSAARAVTGERE